MKSNLRATRISSIKAWFTNNRAALHATPQVPDEMARYKQLLYLAAKLPPLPAEHQTDDNKVQGCVSQVHSCVFTALWQYESIAEGC